MHSDNVVVLDSTGGIGVYLNPPSKQQRGYQVPHHLTDSDTNFSLRVCGSYFLVSDDKDLFVVSPNSDPLKLSSE